jgi:hypothetical protein
MNIKKALAGFAYAILFGAGSSVSGQDWAKSSAPATNWTAVASSADGNKLAAAVGRYSRGPIYTSSDSAATWLQTSAPIADWSSIAASADGSKFVAAIGDDSGGGGIYTSSDSGTTWVQTSAPVTNQWTSVASSADGSRLVAANREQIYWSSDFGSTWTPSSGPATDWTSVACSADGTKWTAVAVGSAAGVYLSTNSAATWTLSLVPGLRWEFGAVVSSADGTQLAAAGGSAQFGGPIYLSTDAGGAWTPTLGFAPGVKWRSVACSADGNTIVAGGLGPLVTSTNRGTTWTFAAVYEDWLSVASSADGSKRVAASASGIYLSQSAPAPLLDIRSSDTNLVFSWLIPSIDVRLQENSVLTASTWTNVAKAPTLNLTNLRQETILSAPTGTRFYRLKQP